MTDKKILLFGFSDDRGKNEAAELRRRLRTRNTSAEMIEKKDYLKPIGELAGMLPLSAGRNNVLAGNPGEYRGSELPVRLLVFAGFDGDELDDVLHILPGCGITKNDLKAVLTPVNASWNALGLCNELMREHRQMKNS